MCFFVPEKGHPYPGLAMTGIVTFFKNLAKFGIILAELVLFEEGGGKLIHRRPYESAFEDIKEKEGIFNRYGN
jgi:hypothetical protein